MSETTPLTGAELAKVRELFLRPAPPTDQPWAWRRWAADLTWINAKYAARLIATLDEVRCDYDCDGCRAWDTAGRPE